MAAGNSGQPAAAAAEETSAAPARQGLVLAALILVAAVANLPLASANVALPSIGLHFNASQTQLNLVAICYSLGLAVSVLWLGALGDRYGRKQMLMLGVAISLPACLLMAWAPSIGVLIGARFIGGVAAGMAYPTTLSLITALWSGPRRTRCIALWSATGGAISALGPLLAGLLLAKFWWGSVFLITIPLIVVAIPLSRRLIPSHVNETDEAVDNLGGILSAVLVGALILAINFAVVPDKGALVFGLAVIAVAGIVAFVIRERRTPEPLYDLHVAGAARLLGGRVCRDHRLREPHGGHVHRAAVPPERAGLLDGRRRAGHPPGCHLHGSHRPQIGQAGRGQGGTVHPAGRLRLHLPRVPHHAGALEGGHPLLGGGDGLCVRGGRRGLCRDTGIALADGLGARHPGGHGLGHRRSPARPRGGDHAVDHGSPSHGRLRRRLQPRPWPRRPTRAR